MLKIRKRFVSAALAFIVVFSTANPVLSQAANADLSLEKESIEERTDLTFIEGTPGKDTYLVYTYTENGKQFKVVDNADPEYNNVHSVTYVMDSKGNYIEQETKDLKKQANGEFNLRQKNADGDVKNQRITSTMEVTSTTQSAENPQASKSLSKAYYDPGTGEWITVTRNGSTFVQNLSINGIIGAIGGALSIVRPITGNLLTAVALYIFNEKVKTAYFHEVYNYMYSKYSVSNFYKIREAISIDYYSDSSHKTFIGHKYFEYDGRY